MTKDIFKKEIKLKYFNCGLFVFSNQISFGLTLNYWPYIHKPLTFKINIGPIEIYISIIFDLNWENKL